VCLADGLDVSTIAQLEYPFVVSPSPHFDIVVGCKFVGDDVLVRPGVGKGDMLNAFQKYSENSASIFLNFIVCVLDRRLWRLWNAFERQPTK